jgi:3-methyladenine DNA glycosylase/8-oxoguanine DNA glycosylase
VGPYRLALMRPGRTWTAPLPEGRHAEAWQQADGRVVVRASDEEGVAQARFMLALDDDTADFHRRFARDGLLGPTVRLLAGWRPLRVATVAHAVLRAVCGQLIESRRARAIEHRILRVCGDPAPTQASLLHLSPARLAACDLAPGRASTLVRLCRTLDLERLRAHPSEVVAARLGRERGVGPWTIGVIAVEGLGRYDTGLVGDLGLIKLAASLRGRWADADDTAELLAPYAEWQGLAGEMLLLGWSKGLVPGADAAVARRTRLRARRAA